MNKKLAFTKEILFLMLEADLFTLLPFSCSEFAPTVKLWMKWEYHGQSKPLPETEEKQLPL